MCECAEREKFSGVAAGERYTGGGWGPGCWDKEEEEAVAGREQHAQGNRVP